MAITGVTSWYVDQLNAQVSSPKRRLLIGTSDWSDHVTRWPTIKRTQNDLRAVNPRVNVSNANGEFNIFYDQLYLIPQTVTLDLGFTHPGSDTEYLTLYTGELRKVQFPDKVGASLFLRDKLWELSERVIGDNSNPVSLAAQIPSDQAWTIATCYGQLSDVESTSNPDIDYDSFLAWAGVMSADTLETQAYFEGETAAAGIIGLTEMTDSLVWTNNEGKIEFARVTDPSTFAVTLTNDTFASLKLDLEGLRLVNKQYVNFNYDVDSGTWADTVFDASSTSVNTFGLNENITESPNVWYVNSQGALNYAQRQVQRLDQPPRVFTVNGFLGPVLQEPGDTMNIVDAFFGVTSASGWGIATQAFDFQNLTTKYEITEALFANAFILDVSFLDGDDLLL